LLPMSLLSRLKLPPQQWEMCSEYLNIVLREKMPLHLLNTQQLF